MIKFDAIFLTKLNALSCYLMCSCKRNPEDLATAIAREELVGLTESERRNFHARQLRKLGLHAGSNGAAALWQIITDFDRFDPWVA